jgi:CDP-diacylglycerol--glycerol-3-phosphate 3-phosphatidyltransferase
MATGNQINATSSQSGEKSPPAQLFDRRSLNLPNLITISRLGLAGVLFAIIDAKGYWITAAALFAFAASTDALDGWIARKYGQITILGRILDPFVDKIIVGGAFIFLLNKTETLGPGLEASSGVTAWMVIIIIGREMFVSSLRGFLEKQGQDFSADWIGKIKMFLQCVAVTASLLSLSPKISGHNFLLVRDILLWTAVGVTAYSGLAYVWRAAILLRARPID